MSVGLRVEGLLAPEPETCVAKNRTGETLTVGDVVSFDTQDVDTVGYTTDDYQANVADGPLSSVVRTGGTTQDLGPFGVVTKVYGDASYVEVTIRGLVRCRVSKATAVAGNVTFGDEMNIRASTYELDLVGTTGALQVAKWMDITTSVPGSSASAVPGGGDGVEGQVYFDGWAYNAPVAP